MTNEDPSLQYKGVGEGGKVGLSKEIGKKKERIDMLCLQETKKEQLDKVVCQALWGDWDVSWELQPTCNSA